VRWRGSFETAADDVPDYAVKVCPDVLRGNPDGFQTLTPSPCVAPKVSRGDGLEVVRQSINFDREARGLAVKIEDKRAEWMLATKLETFRTKAKNSPKSDLCRAHSFS
jgi:hypothetical protein